MQELLDDLAKSIAKQNDQSDHEGKLQISVGVELAAAQAFFSANSNGD